MILLCHEMKWEYQTYLQQPTWFLIALRAKMNLDAKYQNLQVKKAKRI